MELARKWHEGLSLTYAGIDLGRNMVYGLADLVNRHLVIEQHKTQQAGSENG